MTTYTKNLTVPELGILGGSILPVLAVPGKPA